MWLIFTPFFLPAAIAGGIESFICIYSYSYQWWSRRFRYNSSWGHIRSNTLNKSEKAALLVLEDCFYFTSKQANINGSIQLVSWNPEIPKWTENKLTPGQACAPMSDGVCANAFSLTVTLNYLILFYLFLKQVYSYYSCLGEFLLQKCFVDHKTSLNFPLAQGCTVNDWILIFRGAVPLSVG